MKSDQIKQDNNDTSAIEFKLQPVEAVEKLKVQPENYDGGFHIQSSGASKSRIISKRSALQEFTCR